MKIITNGNNPMTFEGKSAKAIVLQMMRNDYITATKTDYMLEVEERLRVVYGIRINFNNHSEFLREREKKGFISFVEKE